MKKRTIKQILNTAILNMINKLQYPCLAFILKKRSCYVYGYFDRLLFYTKRNNIGDDLNIDFFEHISRRLILKAPYVPERMRKKHGTYSFIGSVLEYVCSQKDSVIVWGTGFKYAHNNISSQDIAKNKYLAVRGPLSREIIIQNGGICPEIYGDPIILLSNYYKLSRPKMYKYGIIPHKLDLKRRIIGEYKDDKQFHIIDITTYKTWKVLVDEICSCDYIISSSLHGIIIADSYGIPNIWARFSEFVDGDGFKFQDYFGGVGKNVQCIDLSNIDSKHIIDRELKKWTRPIVHPSFERVCPIKICKSNV